MKTTLLISMFLLGTVPVFASLDSNLKYGQKSDSVMELQEFLNDKGLLTSSPTGFFGILTLKAVKSYQTSKGLPSTGFVGQMTRGEINKELAEELAISDEAEIAEMGTTTPVAHVQIPTVQPVSTGNYVEVAPVAVAPVVETPVVVSKKDIRVNFYKPVISYKTTGGIKFRITVLDDKGTEPRGLSAFATFGEEKKEMVACVGCRGVYDVSFMVPKASGTKTILFEVPELNLEKRVTLEVTE
jgi:peptidoglycan hydrolase-like protein with peptidoglycan-binding domain